MTTILVDVNDSPKIYMLVKNIYGSLIDVDASDFTCLTYTVSKLSGTTKTAVTGFENVAIDTSTCYWTSKQTYPSTIVATDTTAGYNLVIFPYAQSTVNNLNTWVSPFTESGTTYQIDVKIGFFMSDAALSGSNNLVRTIPIRVQTRS